MYFFTKILEIIIYFVCIYRKKSKPKKDGIVKKETKLLIQASKYYNINLVSDCTAWENNIKCHKTQKLLF